MNNAHLASKAIELQLHDTADRLTVCFARWCLVIVFASWPQHTAIVYRKTHLGRNMFSLATSGCISVRMPWHNHFLGTLSLAYRLSSLQPSSHRHSSTHRWFIPEKQSICAVKHRVVGSHNFIISCTPLPWKPIKFDYSCLVSFEAADCSESSSVLYGSVDTNLTTPLIWFRFWVQIRTLRRDPEQWAQARELAYIPLLCFTFTLC